MAQILIVDDDPDTMSTLARDRGATTIRVRHPEDVAIEDLQTADLVLVDYRLENWPGRDELTQISLKPLDGLALASVLRGHVEGARKARPTAFALHGADLTRLSAGVPTSAREHVIARLNNLEWAFSKTGSEAGVGRLAALAQATSRLPNEWPDSPQETRQLVEGLLGMDKSSPWFETAAEDIESCNAPVHDLATASHGLSFLRWLAHRILPYPTFVIGNLYLAARLGLTVESLQGELSRPGSALAQALEPCRYNGLLADFVSDRWWRAGVSAWLWELTSGNPFEQGHLLAGIQSLAPTVDSSKLVNPVVAVDEDYRPAVLIEQATAVQIQLDDWPLFADGAWISAERAKQDPIAMDLVVIADREDIGSA
jgi:CheY-like chemotaxis protein